MVSFKAPVLYTFVAIKPVENIMFDNASNSLISPTVENTRYLQCFLQFFDVPMPVANSNIYIYIRNPSKTLFLTVFFPMFPVKQTVIYTFFAITSVQNTCFCSVFNALASKKPCKILLCTMFFSFLAVFPLPESYQNDPKFHFNTLLRSDTQKSSKNVGNTT